MGIIVGGDDGDYDVDGEHSDDDGGGSGCSGAVDRLLRSFPIHNPLLQSEVTFTISDNLLNPFSGK